MKEERFPKRRNLDSCGIAASQPLLFAFIRVVRGKNLCWR